MTYTDENGYRRSGIKHSDLIHRQVAYRQIYLKNRQNYSHPFGHYQVHHIDGNKKNNKASNLQILTKDEHEREHGVNTDIKTYPNYAWYTNNNLPDNSGFGSSAQGEEIDWSKFKKNIIIVCMIACVLVWPHNKTLSILLVVVIFFIIKNQ